MFGWFKKKVKPSYNLKILRAAASQIGTKELAGRPSNPEVEKYLDAGFVDNESNLKDNIPWCAGFVAWVLELVGLVSTNSLMARSYQKWGMSVKMHPEPGDVIVFWRGSLSARTGHVGIYLGPLGRNKCYVIGGNQNDEVNISVYSFKRVLDIRRTEKQYHLSNAEQSELKREAEKILFANSIYPAGTMV